MGKGKRSKQHNIGHANYEYNRERRIAAEIKRAEKKMEKLLRLFKEGRQRSCGDTVRKTQGMMENSVRHKKLQSHISILKAKLGRK